MSVIDVKVPDIGDFADVPVIEILVKPGDTVAPEDPLIMLESDKATLEVPAPTAGKVVEIVLKVGDKVKEGSVILHLEPEGRAAAKAADPPAAARTEPPKPETAPAPQPAAAAAAAAPAPAPSAGANALPIPTDFGGVFASPSVRRLARELDIDLTTLKGTGEKGRITKEDVKAALGRGPAAGGTATAGIPAIPEQDFSQFGAVTVTPLSRLKRISGPHLHRSWLNIPHVTHSDEADITELESYRKKLDAEARDKGYRVTLLSFLLMASVAALKQHPEFNASLTPDGDALVFKHYFNIGVAVDTPDGLVVPVIKDVDRKRILELSQELATVSQRMRDGKIAPADIRGASFTISSLGGIGGTGFTPIVNAPEVAILGVARAAMRPVWTGDTFVPRLMLPLSLSYDHRVIDGALAARFTRRLAELLGDVRQLVL